MDIEQKKTERRLENSSNSMICQQKRTVFARVVALVSLHFTPCVRNLLTSLMKSILNSQRLLQLYQFHPKLKDLWYLIAASTFSACNQPQEIPKLYHYAMLLSNGNANKYRVTVAYKTTELLSQEPTKRSEMIEQIYRHPSEEQRSVTKKLREAMLKSAPLAGLPKAINSLQILKEYTPSTLLSKTSPIDPWEAAMTDEIPCPNTERHICETRKDHVDVIHDGLRHWNSIYNKVSSRVVNNLHSSYPDLWYFVVAHVYGPLFSFDDILSVQETSLIVIASLVPQDVNPQLKGHLRGALNIGCDFDTIEAARQLAVLVAQWCGIEWEDGIVKLLPKKHSTAKR
ncbi:Pxp2p KNAG_0D01240 [Huiozyma naganishii CBS 8797]|uniref:Uncharacterized protein n=1 Tax=Huiozyma naganishii (strain ATCC MYA-139 / BCRC 22969 / CBS 8797 / KCTC 17520 / NBRC 10181 / NCYC 3082 / Yp74L-3) TaxID=1071383 RepID=J7S6N4_HUIN7|nr:hypothetical protein KNAG_0D01240 [Kazachstania naganishii CBS 8797]CCK69876.1 hypothetical protein KNAG_0D01240 [Kazachstania naganishii CBS 8797]